jgi:hypothetical protein
MDDKKQQQQRRQGATLGGRRRRTLWLQWRQLWQCKICSSISLVKQQSTDDRDEEMVTTTLGDMGQ